MKKYFTDFFGSAEKNPSLQQMREKLLNEMLLSSLVVGTILFALALIPATEKRVYVSIFIYGFVYILILFTTFLQRMPYGVRVFNWLSVIYLLGAINLYMNGFNVDAGLLFLTLISMAALFGGVWRGVIALVISTISIFIAGSIIVSRDVTLRMDLPQDDPILWIIGSLVFLLVGVFLIVSVTTLVRGLQRNLLRTTALANDLVGANETLLKSEERFRSLIEGSSDIIAILAGDGTIRYVSPSSERIMGYAAEELLGQKIFKFLHPEDVERGVAALSPGTPAELIGPMLELRILHKNGSWRYLEVKGQEMRDRPLINGTVVNCRDITDRKEMEENLRKSQLLLQKTFASLSDALFLIDANSTCIIDCNEAASKIFGYDKDEFLQQTPALFFSERSANDDFNKHLNYVRQDSHSKGHFETWMKRKNGTLFPVECSVAPLIDIHSGHIGWVSLVHDITERKHAEQLLLRTNEELEQRVIERTVEVERTSKQLKELVAHSPAVIYSADISDDFEITFVSENAGALSGYEVAEFLKNKSFWKRLIHPNDLVMVLTEIERTRRSGAAAFDYRFLHKQGDYRWVHDEMKLIKDERGTPKEFVGSWVNITEQKMAEHALREIEETNRVLLNATDASISLIDPNGVVLAMNDAGAEMLGMTPREILGRCIYDIFPADFTKARKTQVDAICLSGKPAHYEDFRDGYWFDNRVYPVFDEHGKVSRLVTHAYNITESKRIQESLHQSEERYRTLAEASPDLIYIIGKDDRVQYLNSYASSFLHMPINKVVGQPREKFFAPATNKHQKDNILKVLKSGMNIYAEDNTRMGDRSMWLGTWLVPLRDADGNVSAVLGVSRDITLQKQAELEILKSRDKLEERVKERTTELIASQKQLRHLTNQLVTAQEEERRRISRELHDESGQAMISLKYSLTSIMSELPEAHLIGRERLADAIMVTDLMMAQIRSLAHSLRPPVLEIGGINLSLQDYCEEFTERTGVSIQYRGEEIPNLPDEIGISLYRFVQETLTNILKHAHATKVTINLRYRKKQISLAVSDNGRGMSDTILSDGMGLLGVSERFKLIEGDIRIDFAQGAGSNCYSVCSLAETDRPST